MPPAQAGTDSGCLPVGHMDVAAPGLNRRSRMHEHVRLTLSFIKQFTFGF